MVALLLAFGPAQAREVFAGTAWYRGDLHAHTSYSTDGASAEQGDCLGECGPIDTVFATARANGLDFVAITDHLNGSSEIERPQVAPAEFAAWWALIQGGDDTAGGFVVIPAGEVYFATATAPFGHKTLLFFGPADLLAGFTYAEAWPTGVVDYDTLDDCAQIDGWLEGLQAAYGDVLALPHHPMATRPMPTDWGCHTERWEPAVEVYSRHGTSLDPLDPYDPLQQGITSEGAVAVALDPAGYGYDLGFVAGTDRHDTRPGEVCALDQSLASPSQYGGGLTLVALPEGADFDRAAIHDAIVAHHTVASSGPAIPLSVSFTAEGRGLGGLGDRLTVPEGSALTVRVAVPDSAAPAVLGMDLIGPSGPLVPLVAEGGGVWEARVGVGAVDTWVYVDVRVDGDVWWGPGACEDGGADALEHLWASPSRVEVGPPAEDTGVTASDTASTDTAPTDTALTDTAGTEPADSAGEEPPAGGCGCGTGGLSWLLLGPAFVWRRRARSSAGDHLPSGHPDIGDVRRTPVEDDRR